MTVQQILAAAEELSPLERHSLLNELIDRYSPPAWYEPTAEFLAELHRRSLEMDTDPEASIDGDLVMAKVRAMIGRDA